MYVGSILDEINVLQDEATPFYVDNNRALMMGNAQQPTRHTKHMDIQKLVIQDWVQGDLITMKWISTSDNYADAVRKLMGCQLHYRHSDYILGKNIPLFAENICGNKSLLIDGSLDKPQPLGSSDHFLCSPKHGGKIPKGVRLANYPLSKPK